MFNTDICPHRYTVLDIDGGSEVCTQCGLVLEERLLQSSNEEKSHILEIDKDNNFLKDICERLELSNERCYEALICLPRIIEEIQEKEFIFKRQDLLTFALYEVINRNEIGITPEELCHYANIKTQKLWQIENSLCNSIITQHSPAAFCSKACYHLNLKYSDERQIRQICESMYGCSHFRPTNVCGTVIKLYCKEKNIPMTYKKICEALNCSATSMIKIIDYLGDIANNISILCDLELGE